MARQVLPIVGAIVGAYFGNPQLGYAIGAAVGNAVDPQVINGPKLGEGQVNTAREGAYRPIVLGIGCVGANIINVGPEIIRTKRDRQSKGGGPVVKTKRRYRTFALRISEPVAGLLRIWQGEKLVYDVRAGSQIPEDSAKYAEGFTFYNGSEDQLPDPDLEAYLGVGNANAYRGTAYIVFKHFDLTDTQGGIPQFRFEVFTEVGAQSSTTIASGFASTAPGSDFTSVSATGTAFGAPEVAGSAQWMIPLTYPRIFGWNNGENSWITDDFGVTKVNVGSLDEFGGPHLPAYENGVLLIPGSLNGIYRSTDEGLSINLVPGSPFSSCIASTDGLAVSVWDPSEVDVSINAGLSWIKGGDTGLYTGAAVSARTTMGDALIFAGKSFDEEEKPAVSITRNGSAFNKITIESSVGTTVTAICSASIGGSHHVVLTTDVGEVYWTDDEFETIHLSDDEFTAVDIAHNGTYFILAGDQSSSEAIGYTATGESIGLASENYGGTILSVAATYLQALSAGKIPVSYVLAFIHARCGHTASQYDVSEMIDEMDGVVFADGYTGADAIKTLLPIYFADASEHDAGGGYKINYIKRGKPVVRTITIDDLVDEPDEAVRQDSLERPAKLHLHFQNPTIGYAAAKATSARTSPDVLVTGEVSVQVPVTFSDVNEAWQIANKLHKIAWVEVAGTQELVLAENSIDLVPTDCIGLFLRGQLIRYRMTSQAYADGMLKCEFMADRQSAVTSNVTGIDLPEPPPPPTSIVGPTISAFLDIPALLDGHDALVSYAAATGQTPAWWGADYERSLDAGANYALATEFDGFNTIMGVLVDTVDAASPHYTDTTNVVRVTLYTDDPIESLTLQQFLSEGGAFALSWEDSGHRKWEILQYRDAEQDSSGDWLLSTLLRGRLNTEAAEHLPGATFVLLDNSVHVMPMQSAWLDMELTHRAVSNGETPESAVPYTDEFTGQSQTEWPVANLLLDRDGDSIEVTAVPRHRFGTDDAPVQSINHDGYRWTATDGVNTLTADTDPPTHTFDVTGWSTPVTVTVAQLNRITGAGPTVSEDIA